MKPKDEITGAKKILGGLMYKSVGVSYFTVDQWQMPESLGFDLEILPLTDLSNVRTSDIKKLEKSRIIIGLDAKLKQAPIYAAPEILNIAYKDPFDK